MEFNAEDLSPVRKKVTVTVSEEEIAAAIGATIAVHRPNIKMDGFRPGKVPASMIESRMRDSIYEEAKQDLITLHINEVREKLQTEPLAGIAVEAEKSIERGKPYTYTLEFEVLPKFDLPAYEGLEVEKYKVVVDEAEIDELVEAARERHVKLVPADGTDPAKDGQVATIDFAAFENGVALPGVSAQNFDLWLGKKQALPEFEELVKTIGYGQEGEGEVTFPEDFLAKDLAGKKITMRVKVHAVKNRELPALDDEFAKKMGKQTMAEYRESLIANYKQVRENLFKAGAEKKLLDALVKMADYELPKYFVDVHIARTVANQAMRMERLGKSLDGTGKSREALQEEARPAAEELARGEVMLLAIANKEGLSVSDEEVLMAIYRESMSNGEDFNEVRKHYEESGLVYALRYSLLADKAMEVVYSRAKVTEVEPPARGQAAEGGEESGAAAAE